MHKETSLEYSLGIQPGPFGWSSWGSTTRLPLTEFNFHTYDKAILGMMISSVDSSILMNGSNPV